MGENKHGLPVIIINLKKEAKIFFKLKRKTYSKNSKSVEKTCEQNVVIINLLLKEISKATKAIKEGKKMLQTIHPYWESGDDHHFYSLGYNKIDVNGKPIKYDISKHAKTRNKFLNSKIKENYKPDLNKLINLSLQLKKYKDQFLYYSKHGEPSYQLDRKTLEFKYVGYKKSEKSMPNFLIPEDKKKYYVSINRPYKEQDLNTLNEIDVYIKIFEYDFMQYIREELEVIFNFKYRLEDFFQELVKTVSEFRKHYIDTYSHINMKFHDHAKQYSSYNANIKIFDYFSFIRTFPILPYEEHCQPPNLNLPNIVSLEEKIKYYFYSEIPTNSIKINRTLL